MQKHKLEKVTQEQCLHLINLQKQGLFSSDFLECLYSHLLCYEDYGRPYSTFSIVVKLLWYLYARLFLQDLSFTELQCKENVDATFYSIAWNAIRNKNGQIFSDSFTHEGAMVQLPCFTYTQWKVFEPDFLSLQDYEYDGFLAELRDFFESFEGCQRDTSFDEEFLSCIYDAIEDIVEGDTPCGEINAMAKHFFSIIIDDICDGNNLIASSLCLDEDEDEVYSDVYILLDSCIEQFYMNPYVEIESESLGYFLSNPTEQQQLCSESDELIYKWLISMFTDEHGCRQIKSYFPYFMGEYSPATCINGVYRTDGFLLSHNNYQDFIESGGSCNYSPFYLPELADLSTFYVADYLYAQVLH